jgi:hypothetical protein
MNGGIHVKSNGHSQSEEPAKGFNDDAMDLLSKGRSVHTY